MRVTIIILIAFFVGGCMRKETTLVDYVCTSDQLALVKEEVEVCSKTSYLSSYCFLQAKATLCELIDSPDSIK